MPFNLNSQPLLRVKINGEPVNVALNGTIVISAVDSSQPEGNKLATPSLYFTKENGQYYLNWNSVAPSENYSITYIVYSNTEYTGDFTYYGTLTNETKVGVLGHEGEYFIVVATDLYHIYDDSNQSTPEQCPAPKPTIIVDYSITATFNDTTNVQTLSVSCSINRVENVTNLAAIELDYFDASSTHTQSDSGTYQYDEEERDMFMVLIYIIYNNSVIATDSIDATIVEGNLSISFQRAYEFSLE